MNVDNMIYIYSPFYITKLIAIVSFEIVSIETNLFYYVSYISTV